MVQLKGISRKMVLTGLLYGIAMGLLSVLMYWAKYRFVVIDNAFEIYAGLIAVLFVAVGAWLGNRLTKPKIIIEQQLVIREIPVPAVPREEKDIAAEGAAARISRRELEVLQLLAQGLSNEEIGAQLFVSLNTVKTHLSSIYFKLEVKRRTQAVERARAFGLIA